MDNKLKLHLVSHTHWDREWYLSFQQFRIKLVEVVDEVLDILDADSNFRYFMLDGQTVVLEDYLEIKPQHRERLAKYIREGRLQVGPWYVSPDFFLTSGESTVRNLMLGHRISQEFGATMKAGYLPDVFGHISQMPQILQGFGIDNAVIYRGVGDDAAKTEFYWEASDGSRVLAIYLPDGYCHAANLPAMAGKAVEKVRACVERLAPMATTRNLLLLNGCDHLMPQRELPQIIKVVNQNLREGELVHATLAQHIAAVKAEVTVQPPIQNECHSDRREESLFTSEVRQISLPPGRDRNDKAPELLPAENPSLFTLKGEFRENRPARITPGVLSARIYLKQANHRATVALEKYAEPLSAIAYCLGEAYPAEFLWQAWRYLLQCHPHDSICGCSIDDVHRDMERRFAWSLEISEELMRRALRAIAQRVDTRSVGEGIPLLVFNPMSIERTEVAHCHLTFAPSSLSLATCPDFPLMDLNGKSGPLALIDALTSATVPFQVLKREKTYVNFDPHQGRVVGVGGELISQRGFSRDLLARLKEEGKAQRVEAEQWEILFVADRMPSFGCRTYVATIQPFLSDLREESIESHGQTVAEQLPYVFGAGRSEMPQNLNAGADFLENEFFKIKIAPNGTLIVDHKETGESYAGLHYFEDRGDAGDEYNFSPPPKDAILTTLNEKPRVFLKEQGPVRATLKIEYNWKIPKSLSEDRQARSQEHVDYPITSYVSLYPSILRIDICTEVENQAEDHRLRVGFASNIKASHSFAEMPFDVVQRKMEFSEENALPEKRVDLKGGEEVKVGTYPQDAFVSIADEKRGLTLINRGLPEYEVLPDEKGSTIFLTLLRCVGWLSRGDLLARKGNAGPSILTPEAQCLGRYTFHYALVPHRGDWEAAKSYLDVHGFNSSRYGGMQEMDCQEGSLSLSRSFVSIQPPELVLSAFKKAESGDEMVLRFYNVASREVQGCVRFFLPIEEAAVVNLNEELIDAAPLKIEANSEIFLTVPSRKIVTIRCKQKCS